MTDAATLTLKDPDRYPVVFVLPDQSPRVEVEETAVVPFVCDAEGASLVSAVCRFSGKYLFDVDPYGTSVPFVREGRRVVYEVAPNSRNISTSELTVMVWISSTSFFVLKGGEHGDLRQALSSSGTTHSVYLSASSAAFDALVIGGVPFYPSIHVDYLTDPFTDGTTAPVSGTISVPGGQNILVADGGDKGITWIRLDVSTDWYLDSGRTVPAPVPPPGVPGLSGSVVARAIFADGGKFFRSGEVSGGVARFAGLPKGSSAPSTGITYLGTKESSEVFTAAAAVHLKDSGLPDQPGNDGATYLLPVP